MLRLVIIKKEKIMRKPILELLKKHDIIEDFKMIGDLKVAKVIAFNGREGIGDWGSNQYKYTINFPKEDQLLVCLKEFKTSYRSVDTMRELEKIQSILA